MTAELFLNVTTENQITVQVPKDVWDQVIVLAHAGVFDIPYGRATLNYAEGKIATISVEKRTYDRKDIPKRRTTPL